MHGGVEKFGNRDVITGPLSLSARTTLLFACTALSSLAPPSCLLAFLALYAALSAALSAELSAALTLSLPELMGQCEIGCPVCKVF